jgi:hypothetical protein
MDVFTDVKKERLIKEIPSPPKLAPKAFSVARPSIEHKKSVILENIAKAALNRPLTRMKIKGRNSS